MQICQRIASSAVMPGKTGGYRLWQGLLAMLAISVLTLRAAEQSAAPAVPLFTAAYQDGADFRHWQQQTRQLAEQSLLSPPAVLTARLLQTTHQPHYQQASWQVTLQFGHEQVVLPVDLLLPQQLDKTKPALLLLHDHGAEFRLGRHKYLAAGQSPLPELTRRWQHKYFDGVALAPWLAGAGYPVLVADAPGFGERGPIRYADQQQLAASFLARGGSLAGRVAREDQALAVWLSQQLQQPVLAVGFSFGGFRALQLAALEPAVRGAVSIGWFNSLQFLRQPDNNFAKGQTAFYMLHPGLYQALDLPQFWALAAPKPLLVLMGALDPLMPPAQVTSAFATLQHYYQACRPSSSDRLAGKAKPAALLRTAPDSGHHAGVWFQQQLQQFLAQFAAESVVCSN